MSIALPIGYLLLCTIIMWWIAGIPKGSYKTKLTVIIVTQLYCLVLWSSLQTFTGWPTSESPSDKFLVQWVVVEEPSQKYGRKGAIYFWVKDVDGKQSDSILTLLGYHAAPGEPRAHKFPYSKQMHKEADRIMQMLKKGEAVVGQAIKGKPGVRGDGKGKKRGDGGDLSNEQKFEFHKLPPASLPEKVINN